MSQLRYRSRVDWWLAAIVASAFVFPVMSAVRSMLRGESGSETLGLLGSAALAMVTVCAVGVPMHYTLTDSELVIRFGLLKKRIPYRRIQSAKPSHSPWSSPAWSLDRIEITLDDYGQVLISPVRKEEFIAELMRRVAAA